MRDDIDTRLLDYWLTDREFMELTNPPIEPEPIPIRPLPDRIRSVLRKYWLPIDVREEYVVLLMGVFRDELKSINQNLSRAYHTIHKLRNQVLLEEDIREETREFDEKVALHGILRMYRLGLNLLDDIEESNT